MRQRGRWKEIWEEKQSWKDALPDHKSWMMSPGNRPRDRELCRERHHGGPGGAFPC